MLMIVLGYEKKPLGVISVTLHDYRVSDLVWPKRAVDDITA